MVNGSLSEVDVAVIGGGPAGLAAAIAARQRGLSVALIESARPPIDKACGEGLMPDGQAALRRLGIELDPVQAFPFRGIRFIEGESSVEAHFPHGRGLGVRRNVLHSLLADRAAGCGVQLHWGLPVIAIAPGQVRTPAGVLHTRWIVGADGISSQVRRWAGLEAFARDTRRFGFRAHFQTAPWSEFMEIYWGEGFQLYVTPVAPGEICVVVMSADPHLRLASAIARTPVLRERLAGVPQSSAQRGALTATRRLRAVYRDRVALIGDASGSADAITGEGLCLSFHQALDLADALAAGDLRAYAAAHRRHALRPAFMAGVMLTLGARRWLRRHAVRALSVPGVFNRLLAFHLGS